MNSITYPLSKETDCPFFTFLIDLFYTYSPFLEVSEPQIWRKNKKKIRGI